MKISFKIDCEPVPKERPKWTRHGHMYTPPKTKKFEAIVNEEAKNAMAGRKLIEGAVKVLLEFGLPIPKSWSKKKKMEALIGNIYPMASKDLDNMTKSTYDGMNKAVYKDDVQIVKAYQEKIYVENPYIKITVEEL